MSCPKSELKACFLLKSSQASLIKEGIKGGILWGRSLKANL